MKIPDALTERDRATLNALLRTVREKLSLVQCAVNPWLDNLPLEGIQTMATELDKAQMDFMDTLHAIEATTGEAP